ncbi:MAG: hypothetical protein QOF16_602 [Actinomycetota bacterium]|nr:hypothetical protein [Actinomycetota bacterium]
MRRAVLCSLLAVALALVSGACYGGDNPNLASSGKGKPQLSIDFPGHLDPGQQADLVLDVSNPGPGDIGHVFVSFSLLGAPTVSNGQLIALVPIGAHHKNPAVLSVDPKPQAVSSDGDIYRFGPLSQGRSTTITFVLRAPEAVGRAQNSVQVYDGNEPDRSVGVPLEATIGG